ncbi:MAG: ABC transporter substrate-binding protein [Bacteroidia bacterium]|nr:ABC transporter substrate-binding protein [Bacteroidia bacterium]
MGIFVELSSFVRMEYTDQLGNQIQLNTIPKRIVSLVPSQSEFLWDLGLQKELIGITKFCIHPEKMFKQVTRVGGTKNPDPDKIRALQPDLIIGNKEENEKSIIEQLSREFPVWMSDVNTPGQALDMMSSLSSLTGRESQGNSIIEASGLSLTKSKEMFRGQSVAYFIWNAPYHFAGSETFIHSVLTHIGLKNVFSNQARYPELSLEKLADLRPDYCFLSSEPFPFREEHLLQIQKALPDTRVVLVDGEAFSWYGSRLIYLHDYLTQLKTELYA